MPGFDSSGPLGAGPMTGGGRGRCHPARAGVAIRYAGRYGRGLGLKRSFRGGFGRGLGNGRRHGRSHLPAAEGLSPMESAGEMERLHAAADDLQKSLEAINRRIQSLGEDATGES